MPEMRDRIMQIAEIAAGIGTEEGDAIVAMSIDLISYARAYAPSWLVGDTRRESWMESTDTIQSHRQRKASFN